MAVEGKKLSAAKSRKIARGDGFKNLEAMLQWFDLVHGLPFRGAYIGWK